MSEEYRDWQDGTLKVVKNHEGTCSIWPVDREEPLGWESVGFSGTKDECLNYIKTHCDADCRFVG
jgi:MbtH protein